MRKEAISRDQLVAVGWKLYDQGLIAGTAGNISCRLDQNTVLITPGGRPKGELEPDEMVIINLKGQPRRRDQYPSSEYRMHLTIYKSVKAAKAVIHAHPPFATAYSIVGKRMPVDSLAEGVLTLKNMAWVNYAAPSTDELAQLIAEHLPQSDILILKNHGVTTIGSTLEEAFLKLETLEHCAKICFHAQLLGQPKKLNANEIRKLRAKYKVSG